MRKLGSILIAGILCAPFSVSAQLVISEVMYDLQSGPDSGREWIEVYNESGSVVDLTEWKLYENNTNHGITAPGSSELAPGAYAVIADNAEKFKADWPLYSGPLFDSAFSLNNTGESLGLRCCGKELADKDSISYSNAVGGAGDGASLSRSGQTWVPTDPTPGQPPSAARASDSVSESVPPEAQKLPEPPAAEEKQTTPAPTSEPDLLPASAETHIAEPQQEAVTPAPLPAATKKIVPRERAGDTLSMAEESGGGTEVARAETQVAASAAAGAGSWTWWAGAFGISLIGATGAYLAGRRRAREWTIIEESGKDV